MVRSFSLDDKTAVFAFRGVVFLALTLLLLHSPRQEQAFQAGPFALAVFYLLTSFALWRVPPRVVASAWAQGAAYLWDVAVVSAIVYSSEGFDDELYLMYFLIMFMSGLMSQARQSFLIGTVSSLIYAALWSKGKVGEGLPLTNLLLRFAFFYVVAFFTAVMAERVREGERRSAALELKVTLSRIANGGWGQAVAAEMAPTIDPDIAKNVRTINSLIDNLTRALRRTMSQNEELREAAEAALLQLAHERERLEAASGEKPAPKAPDA
ncbi:MAG: hypothetical protein HY079_14655 [Elusimicrobia bacterium]|nr:hypothetical protein [Elusimicrobiota bacterium]